MEALDTRRVRADGGRPGVHETRRPTPPSTTWLERNASTLVLLGLLALLFATMLIAMVLSVTGVLDFGPSAAAIPLTMASVRGGAYRG
jgi:hypothetical protein